MAINKELKPTKIATKSFYRVCVNFIPEISEVPLLE